MNKDKTQENVYLLEKESVPRALLKLGLPTMTGMLVSALYNIADAFFVGRLGTVQTAAVSVVYPLTMIGTGIGLLFGSGAGSYVSRLLGKKAYDRASVCASTAVFSGTWTIAVLTGAILLFFDPLMGALGAAADSMPYVRAYGVLYTLGLLFNVFNMMMNNLLVAEGNSTLGMAAMLAGGILNIALDPLFIFGCGWGVADAA